MIGLLINKRDHLVAMYSTATHLGKAFGKRILLMILSSKCTKERLCIEELKNIPQLSSLPVGSMIEVKEGTWCDACEQHEISLLMVQKPPHKRGKLTRMLKTLRNLRCPYLFLNKEDKPLHRWSKILLPIGFLAEEKEKAQYAIAFGRWLDGKTTILVAKDYGNRANKNADSVISLFEKFGLDYTLKRGKKDSFGLDRYALKTAHREQFDLLIVSASRSYGLDDILFAPKEYHLLKDADVPILMVNPRADLYALCQ